MVVDVAEVDVDDWDGRGLLAESALAAAAD